MSLKLTALERPAPMNPLRRAPLALLRGSASLSTVSPTSSPRLPSAACGWSPATTPPSSRWKRTRSNAARRTVDVPRKYPGPLSSAENSPVMPPYIPAGGPIRIATRPPYPSIAHSRMSAAMAPWKPTALGPSAAPSSPAPPHAPPPGRTSRARRDEPARPSQPLVRRFRALCPICHLTVTARGRDDRRRRDHEDLSKWERNAMEGVATYAHDAQMDTAPAGARTRILLIDDEPTILSFVSRILRGHGFSVDCAADGAQGLAMIRERREPRVRL